MKILLVDDSRTIRNIQKNTLSGMGHTDVLEAADGTEALAVLKGERPDLVLVDWNMPKMDGITLIRELRKLPSYKYIPMIMLTTETAGDKKAEGKSAGATGWLVKPFNPDQLLATIKKVMA